MLALCSVAALAAPPARATVVVAKDFAALCAEADLIFVGTVTATTSEWSNAAQQSIRTRVTFGDLTWLRGEGGDRVTLLFAGGELDGLREAIDGVPQFTVGQRRVIFAHAGHYVSPLVGFNQGLFQVVDSPGGPAVLDADGRAVTGVGQAALTRGAPGDAGAALPLDAFLSRVRDQMESH
jgi:hypothetical protein